MSRQLEQLQEEKSRRRHKAILLAVEGALETALSKTGYVLEGFSVNLSGGDCLITLRGFKESKRFVAFVGAGDLGSCLVKALREAGADRLAWRADKYGT